MSLSARTEKMYDKIADASRAQALRELLAALKKLDETPQVREGLKRFHDFGHVTQKDLDFRVR